MLVETPLPENEQDLDQDNYVKIPLIPMDGTVL